MNARFFSELLIFGDFERKNLEIEIIFDSQHQ